MIFRRGVYTFNCPAYRPLTPTLSSNWGRGGTYFLLAAFFLRLLVHLPSVCFRVFPWLIGFYRRLNLLLILSVFICA